MMVYIYIKLWVLMVRIGYSINQISIPVLLFVKCKILRIKIDENRIKEHDDDLFSDNGFSDWYAFAYMGIIFAAPFIFIPVTFDILRFNNINYYIIFCVVCCAIVYTYAAYVIYFNKKNRKHIDKIMKAKRKKYNIKFIYEKYKHWYEDL